MLGAVVEKTKKNNLKFIRWKGHCILFSLDIMATTDGPSSCFIYHGDILEGTFVVFFACKSTVALDTLAKSKWWNKANTASFLLSFQIRNLTSPLLNLLTYMGPLEAHMAKNNDVEIPAHGFLNYVQGLQNKRAHRWEHWLSSPWARINNLGGPNIV